MLRDYNDNMFNFFANHQLKEGDYALKDIRVEQQLGHGNAHVYTASINGSEYALKQIQIKNDYEYQHFLQQISYSKQLSKESQWFVKYHGYLLTTMQLNQYDKKKFAFIVMQRAQENLQQFLMQHRDPSRRLQVKSILRVAEQVLAALTSLQEMHIAHCDIKPENILVMNSSKLTVKLCDVGSCKIVSEQNKQEATILGTIPFLAPQLIRVKNKKMTSSNPFKSDMFSFGLVVLYMITHKKFKSHQRLEVEEQSYKQIIGEWIKQARQLSNEDFALVEILKKSLDFDEYKRPQFKELKFTFFNERKKSNIRQQTLISKLEKDEEARISKMQETSFFQSQPSNQLHLFKSRRFQKSGFTKTASNSSTFKISKNKNSPSPVRRKDSTISTPSPERTEKQQSMRLIEIENSKVIFIDQYYKHTLDNGRQQQKNFVLAAPNVPFKRAETVTILSTCTYDVFYMLQDLNCKKLFLQTIGKEMLGVPLDAPLLKFSKIRMNLSRCQLIGGFQGLFRIVAHQKLQVLQLRMADTEASMHELIGLFVRLGQECPNLQTLILGLQRRIITQQQHSLLNEKIAKLPLRKLTILLNQSYVQYQKQTRWPLPKGCQFLYLDLSNNLLRNVVGNLSISLTSSTSLKQIYLNLQDNGLLKGQIHVLIKSLISIKTLQKLTLNLAHNKIQDSMYLENTLLQLLQLSYLDLSLHKTDLDLKKIISLVDSLIELFEFRLRGLRISCDRAVPRVIFKQMMEEVCMKKPQLRCDVLGFDNSYFTLYIKKNSKLTHRIKGGAVKHSKNSISPIPTSDPRFSVKQSDLLKKKQSSITQGTMTNFNFNSSKGNTICSQLYTSTENFNNFLCVTCCESKEMSKKMYYCSFCMTNCGHSQKQHYFVKVGESTRCVCAYSGTCRSDVKPSICADIMGADLKKQYRCLKCRKSVCLVCVQSCKQSHKEWVQECSELGYFRCGVKWKN